VRVLDASAVVEWLKGGELGEAMVAALGEPGAGPFYAPDLMDVEVASAFRRLVRDGHVDDARATAAVHLLAEVPVERRSATVLLPRVWALRHNLSAYDATYVALAEALDCPLLTCDGRLADAPGHGAEIVRVG
jgi:predicted nucleic acid-binding protein